MAHVNGTLVSRLAYYPAARSPHGRTFTAAYAKAAAVQASTSSTPQSTSPASATSGGSTPSTATASTAKASTAAAPAAAPDWRALFSGTVTPVVQEPGQKPAPTAESVFGPNPWLTSPSGQGPGGAYSYNPFYFATPQTAAKVAAMVGGTVVQSNQFTGSGGAFTQSQPNQMVQLADGRLINPGLVASFYTHGYPQSYIDQMIAQEVRNA
jgi:hypothetical protein